MKTQTPLDLLKAVKKALSKPAAWSIWDNADANDTYIAARTRGSRTDAKTNWVRYDEVTGKWLEVEPEIVTRHSLYFHMERLYVDERTADVTQVAAFGANYYAACNALEKAAIALYGDKETLTREWAPGGCDRVGIVMGRFGHPGLLALLNKAIAASDPA